ncbi:hypothetical protein SAMN04489711_109164 [Paracidovorax wautersii]|uniref:Uncharacterized protein n=1 Tax=Paracidovorax wautersii TaxID=1177982 RepID=A0A1I2F6M5_9BURK|nr:hypothetical protein SAMN04489711_109164 [Paracidovorax wautersii]
MGDCEAVASEAERRCSVNDDMGKHYKPVRVGRQIDDATGIETTTIRFEDQRIYCCSEITPVSDPQTVKTGYLSMERYYHPRGWVQATDEEIRQHEAEVEHQRQLKEEQERIYDAADITLTDLLATSTNLFAVTKKRGVCDDEECHEFEIPLAVFESEAEAEAACLTFAEARAHHDSDVFEVKPLPFFKRGSAR